jgi:hypothetical protein
LSGGDEWKSWVPVTNVTSFAEQLLNRHRRRTRMAFTVNDSPNSGNLDPLGVKVCILHPNSFQQQTPNERATATMEKY